MKTHIFLLLLGIVIWVISNKTTKDLPFLGSIGCFIGGCIIGYNGVAIIQEIFIL